MSRDPTPSPRPLFEFHGGLHLRDTVLWLDAPKARPLCFVSHANVPGSLGHQKILCTDRTAELLLALAAMDGRGRRLHEPQALVTPYRRPFSLGQLSLELFPSGLVLGAASLLVTYQGQSIVYAGEINPRRSALGERLEARHCDVLVLPCRFGQRRFSFPPVAQVTEALLGFVRDALSRGEVAVLFCSPLGEAQEVAALLHASAIPVRAYRQTLTLCRVYERAGVLSSGVRRWLGPPSPGEPPFALLWPSDLRDSPALARLPALRTAFVSGYALDEEVRGAMRCEASFALSCHADYPALLEYVQACKPRQVLLTQRAGGELADDLRALGFLVADVEPPRQMEMF
jgi:putative mRNA 3-end processing factor